MGKVQLARIDYRLIHGQVSTKVAKSVSITHIYVVDDLTANDEFMRSLYVNLSSSYEFDVKVFTVGEVIEEWNKNQFGNDSVLLLFKNVDGAYRTAVGGVPYSKLNVGGAPKNTENDYVTQEVALTGEELSNLVELQDHYDMEVYFQVTPDRQRKSLDGVK